MKINNKVYYRFEPGLSEEGDLIVYNPTTNELYKFSKPYYEFLQHLERYSCLFDIDLLSQYYSEIYSISISEARNNSSFILDGLIETGVVVL